MEQKLDANDQGIFLWDFSRAQYNLKRKYIKHYYHLIDDKIPLHTHDFYEINIITNGCGMHLIEGKEVFTVKGDIFIMPPGVVHGYCCNKEISVYHILLSNRFMAEFSLMLEKLEGYKMLFSIEPMLRSRLDRTMYLKKSDMPFDIVENYISLIESEPAQLESVGEYERALHVLSLIAVMAERICPMHKVNTANIDDGHILDIIECMEYVETHYSENIDYKKLAEKCAVSYSTFLRLFKKLTGTPPSRYHINCKMNTAVNMLLSTSKSVLEIALSCGFYDSSHFIREFTAIKGISPSEFRQKNEDGKKTL